MERNMKNAINTVAAPESSHHTIGINTFSLFAVSLFNAQLWGVVSWWWLPITILTAAVAYGNEINTRKKPTNFHI